MEWRRKFDFISIGFLKLCFCYIAWPVFAHGAGNNAPVWSDEQWKDAKEGMHYKNEQKPEQPEEIKTPENVTYDESDIDFSLSSIFTSATGKVICILIIVLVLAYIVYFMMNTPARNADKRVSPADLGGLHQLEELPEEGDLERFLRMALEADDYKTAVRVLYISSIQRMHQLQYIFWKKDKTNQDYLNEMRGRNNYSQFRDLTLAYEIVWYGDTPIARTQFEGLRKVFTQYNDQLDGTKG